MLKRKLKEGAPYSFKIKSDKGFTLLKSIDFNDQKGLDVSVTQLLTILNEPSQIERKTNHNGEFLFSLKDDSGKIIGNSKCYNSEAGMENGIKNLKNVIGLQSLS